VARRQALAVMVGSGALLWGTTSASQPAHASKLPAFADRAWEAMGGGPSDLTFPAEFLGTWKVSSTLVNVRTLGMRMRVGGERCQWLQFTPS
jgi:hypothetical protein